MRDSLYRLAQRMRPEDPDSCLAELQQNPAFRGDLGWLDRMFDASDFSPVHEVPPKLHDRLLGLLDGLALPDADVPVEDAVLIRDSRAPELVAGVRGSDSRPVDAWSLLYSAPSADLIVDVVAKAGRPARVSGQLLPNDRAVVPFEVRGESLERAVEGDEFNTFRLGEIEPGSHSFVISGEGFAIRWWLELGS